MFEMAKIPVVGKRWYPGSNSVAKGWDILINCTNDAN